MYLKIHNDPKGKVVAVCDENLLGKVLEDKDTFMDLERYRSFYEERKAGADEVEEALKSFDSANIVGKEAVGVAIKMGLAGKKDVMYIKRTPYIQIYRL
ncbi:DUF424 family protein [Candidatus Micrarchaeota archaeon]|nr:DUF424 family protein [Candidatus Micrarchaeota archaeon]